MKKFVISIMTVWCFLAALAGIVSAAQTHTVVSGDSMWKIAVKYEVGLSEIKAANPQ